MTAIELPSDGGFLYGLGAFETIRVQNGSPKYFELHTARLLKTLAFLRIQLPYSTQFLQNSLINYIQKNQLHSCICNLYVTAGEQTTPTTFQNPKLAFRNRPLPNTLPITVVIKPSTYGFNAFSAHKTMGYAPQILERQALLPLTEAMLTDSDGYLVDGTYTSMVLRSGNTLLYPTTAYTTNGVMRLVIAEHLKSKGFQNHFKPVHQSEIGTMDEIFLCNASHTIIPVQAVADIPHLNSNKLYTYLKKNLNLAY